VVVNDFAGTCVITGSESCFVSGTRIDLLAGSAGVVLLGEDEVLGDEYVVVRGTV
jgi:hypothetical protein